VAKHYRASKSRTQGRGGWSVIFRHPVRLDAGTGRPGRRVRRGLATADEQEADALVAQLDQLLSSEQYWEPAAREQAASIFDERVVEIFYDGVGSTHVDFLAVRDQLMPLPNSADGYHHVMLIGTTGAGKTTVVRQILGTDPKTERFPSTSTAKTTVADTEIVLTDSDDYEVVVTFVGRDEIVDYLSENVSEAGLAIFRDRPRAEVLRRLLDHTNQRFRFSYVLGRSDISIPDDDDDNDVDVDDDDDEVETVGDIDLDRFGDVDMELTASVLRNAVDSIAALVSQHASSARATFGDTAGDELVADELIEEALDSELRGTETFHQLVDSLVEEIERRFTHLDAGELQRNRQGWPVSWKWATPDREEFIATVMRFSSNYAPLFGRLLTPLVNGMRVAGPFNSSWSESPPRLVLIDGEGLGHTPNSAATLSTDVAKRLEQVDSVLLVDNAAQPMQAAPVAALKSIAASGNGGKLFVLFTHLDQVKGDNLPTFSAREEHVLASVENVLSAIGDELGPFAERVLRQRVDGHRFFVGGIQEELDVGKKSGTRSISQLEALVAALCGDDDRGELGPIRPVYDRMNLSLAVAEAAKGFHGKWRGLLGIDFNPNAPKEHWARIKALSRRLAEGWQDEYDTLKPVADLRYELQLQVYLMLQRPVRWDNGDPTDEEKQRIIDEISNAISKGLFALTEQRVKEDARLAWQEAYAQRGTGSTFERARIIANDVYDRGAPIPSAVASPDQNSFLRAIAELVRDVAAEFELVLE